MPHDRASTLRYVACVSYPRSGHHLTVRVLGQYFSDAFKYCRFYDRSGSECCQSFPCTNRSVSMTKNHDMDLMRRLAMGIPKVSNVPYFILVRNFLEAVVSDFNLFLQQHDDSRSAWQEFSQRKMVYYKRFVRKWVLADDRLDKLVVRYENLTTQPLQEFSKVISFFHPSEPIDEARLLRIISDAEFENVKPTGIEVIQGYGVRNRRRLEDFKYYDARQFAKLESQLSAEFQQLGYSLRFAA